MVFNTDNFAEINEMVAAADDHFRSSEAWRDRRQNATIAAPRRSACRECKHPDAYIVLDYVEGDYVCNKCGLCQGQVVSTEAEWRCFADSAGPDPSRVGRELDFTLSAASMEVLPGPPPTRNRASRRGLGAQARQRRGSAEIRDCRQRKVNAAISEACARLQLSTSIVNASKLVSLQAQSVRQHGPLAAACIKTACQKAGIARHMEQICWATKQPNCKAAWKVHSMLARAAGATVRETPSMETVMDTTAREGASYARQAATGLGLSYTVGTIVVALMAKARERGVLDGTRPSSVAAGAAFLVASRTDPKLSKRGAARALGISEGAIRRAVKALEPLQSEQTPIKPEPVERLGR